MESGDTPFLIPGVNLKSVGTIRDAQKWPRRDARTDPHRLDQINYNLLSPYTIQKMLNGRTILTELRRVAGVTSEIYSYQGAKIKASSLRKGIHFYELAIHKFLGNSLIKRLEGIDCTSIEVVRQALQPRTSIGHGDWVDLSGLIAPKAEVLRIIEDIEMRRIEAISELQQRLADLHLHYYEYEWTWAYDKIQEFYGIDLTEVTVEQIAELVERWRSSVVELDRELYADAKKEFSLSAMTGFGADGDELGVALQAGPHQEVKRVRGGSPPRGGRRDDWDMPMDSDHEGWVRGERTTNVTAEECRSSDLFPNTSESVHGATIAHHCTSQALSLEMTPPRKGFSCISLMTRTSRQ